MYVCQYLAYSGILQDSNLGPKFINLIFQSAIKEYQSDMNRVNIKIWLVLTKK